MKGLFAAVFLFIAAPVVAQVPVDHPCRYWDTEVSRDSATDYWKRTAQRVCWDYHNAILASEPISPKLAAGAAYLEYYMDMWKHRVTERNGYFRRAYASDRLEWVLKFRAVGYSIPIDNSAEDLLADELGMPLVIEELEQGY